MTDTLEQARASEALGGWMSAALDDPAVCDAMKADIRAWFDAGKPPYSDTLLRRDALAEIDRFIEVWRNSGIDACLAEIETLLLVREKIAGLTPPRIDEHVWSGDGTLGSSDGFDGPICLRCRIGDYGTDTPPECKP